MKEAGGLATAATAFIRAAEAVNRAVGAVTAWATLGCVLACFAVVVLRYGFGIGKVWLQDLYVWQHAAVFLIGAGYTFLVGGHVRVDLIYRAASPRHRAAVDLFGTVTFLLPFLALILVESWPLVASAWAIGEGASQPGGLPAVYILKSFLIVFCALVGLQGLVVVVRAVMVLSGVEPPPTSQPPVEIAAAHPVGPAP